MHAGHNCEVPHAHNLRQKGATAKNSSRRGKNDHCPRVQRPVVIRREVLPSLRQRRWPTRAAVHHDHV